MEGNQQLKKCKYCQSEIDRKARVCPVCKRTLKGHGCLWSILFLLLAVAASVAVFSQLAQPADDKYITLTEFNKIETGKTKQHKKEGFERRSDAKEYERKFLEQKTGSPDMSVHSLYTLYMEDCKTRLKPTTYANKDFLFQKHVLPYLGNLQASNVGPVDIRRWQNTLLSAKKEGTDDPYSQTYLKTVRNQVSAMFNYGVKYYGIKNNPCRQAGAMGKKTADAMQFWTVGEFERFLEAISNKPACVVMFSLLFWTGMHPGEMLALTTADFDFEANTVSITKNYARQNKQDLILEPKTPKSRRTIVMPPTLPHMVQIYLSTLAAIFAYLHTVLFAPREVPYVEPLSAHFVMREIYSYDFATADPTMERVPLILQKSP